MDGSEDVDVMLVPTMLYVTGTFSSFVLWKSDVPIDHYLRKYAKITIRVGAMNYCYTDGPRWPRILDTSIAMRISPDHDPGDTASQHH